MVKQKNQKGVKDMIKQNLLECNKIERSEDKVTARAGLIMFDGFMKAMKIGDIINKHMPVPGSNRGLKAWQYIRPLSLMQYGGDRKNRGLRAGFNKRDGVVRPEKVILEIFETVKVSKNKIQNKISRLAALEGF